MLMPDLGVGTGDEAMVALKKAIHAHGSLYNATASHGRQALAQQNNIKLTCLE